MEYNLEKKYINSDFTTAEIRKAKSIVIKEIENPIISIKEKEKAILNIPIVDIIDITTINQRQYKKTDRLIQVIYIGNRQKLKIISLNIIDNQIEAFINNIRKLKQHTSVESNIKTCFKCNINYDDTIVWCIKCNHKLNFKCIKCDNKNLKDSLICNDCLSKEVEYEKVKTEN